MALLDGARNLFGPIKDDVKQRIYAYLQNPSFERWEDIHGLVIRWDGRINTVWQALGHLDPRYFDIAIPYHQGRRPRKAELRWSKIPDAVTLARAIKIVLDKK
jgi:hypothetical protein